MRRSASEVIRNLEMRVAHLERQASLLDNIELRLPYEMDYSSHSTPKELKRYGLSKSVEDVILEDGGREAFDNGGFAIISPLEQVSYRGSFDTLVLVEFHRFWKKYYILRGRNQNLGDTVVTEYGPISKDRASELFNRGYGRTARLEKQSSHFQLDKNLKRKLDRLFKGLLFSYEVLGLDWSYGESFGGPTLKVTWDEDSISQDGEDGWEEDWMDEGQIRNSDLLPLLDDIEDLVERSYPNSKVLDLQDSVRGQNHLIIRLQ